MGFRIVYESRKNPNIRGEGLSVETMEEADTICRYHNWLFQSRETGFIHRFIEIEETNNQQQ